jgi:hypothetical protein
MHDLARFLFTPDAVCLALQPRQGADGLHRWTSVEHECFETGDNGVATERSSKPRYTGKRQTAVGGTRREHAQIMLRTVQKSRELLVVAEDVGRRRRTLVLPAQASLTDSVVLGNRLRSARCHNLNLKAQHRVLTRSQIQPEPGAPILHAFGHLLKSDDGLT